MTDVNFVSLPGVLTCAVGGVIRAFAWSFNREASQVASARRIENLAGMCLMQWMQYQLFRVFCMIDMQAGKCNMSI